MAGKDNMPRRHTISSITERVKDTVGAEYTVLSTLYTSYSAVDFKLQHNICGNEYTTSVCNFFNGSRCKVCKQAINAANAVTAKKSKYDLNWAKKLVHERGNGEYVLLAKEYINVHSYVPIKHKECNVVFSPTLNNFRQGTRCPNCTDMSRGERHTIDALNQLGLRFEKQKTFPDLKFKRSLRFDFWLIDYNAAIEYDGEQHSRGSGKFYKEDGVERDALKDDYCKKNNIYLIRIPYTKRTVKTIIEYIQSHFE